jgi:hypothetical protein
LRDIAALDRQRYIALATFRRSGAEVRTLFTAGFEVEI